MALLEYLLSPAFIIILITGYLIYFWYTTRRPEGMPPGPYSVPILGGFIAIGTDASQMPQRFTAIARKYGSIFSMQQPSGRWIVVLNDAQSFKEAFLRKSADFAGRPDDYYPVILGIQNPKHPTQGIIWGDYCEQWKRQRHVSLKILRSLGFGRSGIESKICEETQHLANAIEELKEQPFDPHLLLNNAVANIICSLLTGERYEYNDEEFVRMQSLLDTSFEMSIKSAIADTFWFARYIPPARGYLKKLKKAVEEFNLICQKKIDERKCSAYESEDFIGIYLKELQQNATLEDRSFQMVQDFFFAGMETTAVTLTWAFCFMAKYQDVQGKVKDEIFEKIGKTKKPSLDDRDRLPYTEATVCEILRLATTSPFTAPHQTTCNTELFGYKIPKGTEVWGNQWAIVRDPVAFPEPTELRPERFLDEKGELTQHESLIQFGLGRRSCLGEQLAKQELFLSFTHLVQKFHFYPPQDSSLPPPMGMYAITHKCPAYKICARLRM